MRSILTALLAVCFCLPLVGGQESDRELFKLTKARAEKGDAEAQFNLGDMYSKGDGVPEDDREAVKWLHKSAEQGYATAQNNLGNMYAEGEGVPKDDKEAVKWYRKAAEQGEVFAQYNLALSYDIEGVPLGQELLVDEKTFQKEMMKWYRKAAEQGHALAQYNLGVKYHNGEGVPKDLVITHAWWNIAGANGYRGKFPLRDPAIGRIERRMSNIEKLKAQALSREIIKKNPKVVNYNKVFELTKARAEKGDAEDQLNLGVMYRYGGSARRKEAAPIDWVASYAWFNIAAVNGNDTARRMKDEIPMPPEMVHKAQALSKEMVKKNPKLLK